jgi:hypothetical protein
VTQGGVVERCVERFAEPSAEEINAMAAATSDKARPAALLILLKHHFWILAVLVPIVLLPLVFMALGKLRKDIKSMQEQIDGSLTSLKNVRMIPQHPNSSWSNDIDQSTIRVKRETYAEWMRFWNSQKAFRTWPASLGADFVKAAENLKPESKLSRQLLERYQNNVKQLVQELPVRMAVEPAMLDAAALAEMRSGAPPMVGPGMGRGGDPSQPGGRPQGPSYVTVWNPENQRRIYSSFVWEKAPSTAMVVMAQEELRVYGMLCDLIARMNKPATGPHNAAIAAVNELAIGYIAAEDDVGGSAGGRLTKVGAAAGGGMAMGSQPDMMAMGAPGAAGGRPPHPRFGAGSASPMGSIPMEGGGADAAAVPSDDLLANWVYCDFQGKPLDAATLATAPDAQMVHLMPFVMKLTIDQRQVDPLLVELATAPLPIDVRQVRINASGGPGAAGMGAMAMGGMGGMMGSPAGMGMEMSGASGGMGGMPVDTATGAARLYDVQLEVRGSIGLATRPNEQAVGLEPGQGAAPAAGDGKEKTAPAKATGWRRTTRRRMNS